MPGKELPNRARAPEAAAVAGFAAAGDAGAAFGADGAADACGAVAPAPL